MKIILVSVAYPPDPNVGSLRVAKVAEALRGAGHQIVVITARLPGERSSIRASAPGLTVHTVRSIPNPRHVYLWLRGRLLQRPSGRLSMTATSTGEPEPADEPPAWKRLLVSLLNLPDEHQGFILPALRCAWSLGRDAELVYTSTPPHSTHLVGLLLKRWLKIRWIAEFRDPWVARASDRRVRGIERALRSHCLNHVDQAVAVSEGARACLIRHMGPALDDRVVLARNGIDQLAEPTAPPQPGDRLQIAYIGTFYRGRDPRPFLRALAALRRRLSLTPADLLVELVGWCDSFRGTPVDQMAADLGVGDLIRFHGLVPHGRAQAHLAAADLLLLLAQDQPLQVPNKLYEYLGARKPILAYVDADGESARMLRQAGGHFLVTSDDPRESEAALERAVSALRAGRVLEVNESILEEWMTPRQMDRLLRGLALAGGPRGSAVEGAMSATLGLGPSS
jgi:glycosyltransferase involved in cell wall biosynthesis